MPEREFQRPGSLNPPDQVVPSPHDGEERVAWATDNDPHGVGTSRARSRSGGENAPTILPRRPDTRRIGDLPGGSFGPFAKHVDAVATPGEARPGSEVIMPPTLAQDSPRGPSQTSNQSALSAPRAKTSRRWCLAKPRRVRNPGAKKGARPGFHNRLDGAVNGGRARGGRSRRRGGCRGGTGGGGRRCRGGWQRLS